MNRQQLNEYYRKKYHDEKEQRKENNLKKYGTTRSPAYTQAKARYYQRNKEEIKEKIKETQKRYYEKKHLEDITLRSIRMLFVE